MPPTAEQTNLEHHCMSISDVLLVWATDPQAGLTSDIAEQRLEAFGRNQMPAFKSRGPLSRFLAQFKSPLVYVLVAAAFVTAAVGEWVDTWVIMAVVIVNSVVGFIQEERASKALEALAKMTRTSALVVRDDQVQLIDSEMVVPGDLVLLEAGDRVPADIRLIRSNELKVNESALTGESFAADKTVDELDGLIGLADRVNMAYASTLISAGNATGVVVATGSDTEIGRIHQLVGEATGVQTPLTRKLSRFSAWLTFGILVLSGLVLVLGLARGEPIAEMATSAVAIAVAMIPEGLPAVITITLAVGVSRMARRNAIVRKLPAVETLGSTTVICADKTGTLTQNQMTVQFVAIPDGVFDMCQIASADDAESVPPDVRSVLLAGVLCSNATVEVGEPTEVALVKAGALAGINSGRVNAQHPRVAEIPFSSETRYMATAHHGPKAGFVIMKGAPEEVLAVCGGRGFDPGVAKGYLNEFSNSALRVLAFARATGELSDQPIDHLSWELLGLTAMADPPRPEAIAAIKACHGAGIDVKMITGDHMFTAQAIAREMGLLDASALALDTQATSPLVATPSAVLSGTEIAQMDRDQLADALAHVKVIARVTAEQKLRIVRALQSRNEVVAMTGDGVNDAPALKQADIGVAMGLGGTEVAKEAAEIVLTDDNFASIEAAVEEGRGIFANLTKFITWALPTNLGEGLIILTAILAGSTLPISPVQILWVNMTTAVTLGLALAFEPTEPDIMTQPPRRLNQPIISKALMVRMIFVGLIMLAGAYWMFELTLRSGGSLEAARTMAVSTVVAIEIGFLFNCRSLTQSVFRIGFFANRALLLGILAMVGLSLLFSYAPFFQQIFGTAPLSLWQWLAVSAIGLVAALTIGLTKLLEQSFRNRT